jgi:hypothetical protein
MYRPSFRALRFVATGWLLASGAAYGESCTAKFGDPVVFDGCTTIELPTMEIALLRVYGRDSPSPMTCWEYEARPRRGMPVKFENCNTGAMGGSARIRLGSGILTVLYDTPFDCIHWPSGNWGPRYGHRFYEGSLCEVALNPIYDALKNQDQACRSRPDGIWVPNFGQRHDRDSKSGAESSLAIRAPTDPELACSGRDVAGTSPPLENKRRLAG